MEDWNWETIFYGHYRSIFNHCNTIGLKIYRIRWKTQIRAITAFKVIEVGTNRKAVCDFLLVIRPNSNWHPMSYRFGLNSSLLFKRWTLCVFESPFGGLRDNVRCSSWAHWKTRTGLPVSVNWIFFAGVTAESLRAKRDRNKSAISLLRGQFDPKFQVEVVTLTNHFCTDS